MGSDCQTVLKRQKARKANPLDRPREASPGLPPAHTRARESKQRHTRRVDRAPPIRCAPRSARARRRPPLSGDVRCHFVLSMRQRLPGGRGVPSLGAPRARALARPRTVARARSRDASGHDRRPSVVPLAIDPARAARPARSGPAARHTLSRRRAERGRREGGGRLGLGRARRPRPGRRWRTTARDGRRIHADTAAPAPSAVARAPPSPARRRSRLTPNLDPRRSRPASRRSTATHRCRV